MNKDYGNMDEDLDGLFKVLADSRRREVLYSLKDSEADALTYDELVEEMVDEGYISENERERFEVEMNHNHLPVMDEKGIIEYDDRSNTIRPALDEVVYTLLETAEELEQVDQAGFD